MKLFVRNKKGSLSLSMEAIVILILAVVMLGLALAFIRGQFQNLTRVASESVDMIDIKNEPTIDNKVTFTPSDVDMKAKTTRKVITAFYNPSPAEEWWKMELIDDADPNDGSCGGLTLASAPRQCFGDTIEATYDNRPFKLEKDTYSGKNLLLKPLEGAVAEGEAASVYLVSVTFCSTGNSPDGDCDSNSESYSKEIFLTVRR
jgi:hypothetical protein